ncbi:unnamed protein product, partial [Phaeothamnion confervicola]
VAVVLDRLFEFKPFMSFVSGKARAMIVDRADSIGVGWKERVDAMRRDMDALEERYQTLIDSKVETPDYYFAPFHAYEKGNLCWEAAWEVEPSAIAVHSHIYMPKGEFEREGDDRLRSNFHDCMQEMLKGWTPRDVVDVGCSTGLSTLKLAATFPAACVVGVDLSPHMLAVAQHNLATRDAQASRSPLDLRDARPRVSYVHAAGEMTGLADASADLVALCLVSHELPADATRAVFREAARVLRKGGALSFMDMNPLSEGFRRLAANPMAFAGFKSTASALGLEPYLVEYMALDLARELREAGFRGAEARANSPRHRTVVAWVDK